MELRDGDMATEPGRTLTYELWCEMEQLYADDPTAPEANGETDDLRNEELLPPSGRFVIVYDDSGAPVACGAIRRRDAEAAEIKRMYVRPEARGQGLSRLVLRELESTAIDSGTARSCSRPGLRQPEAIALYESHGYTTIPNFGFYQESPLSVCYRRRLDPPIPDAVLTVEDHRKRVGATEHKAFDGRCGCTRIQLEVRQPADDRVEPGSELQAREVHPQALVRTGSEREVVLGRSISAPLVGVVPAVLVAIADR